MNLHEDKDQFSYLIQAVSEAIGLPQVYVEKDYWLTKALRQLSKSDLVNATVFKGGTSLSKAHKLIHRFSEDIDLAVFAEELGDSKRKRLLKSVEQVVSSGLTAIKDERVSKGSNFRKTVYQYPREIEGDEFGQASPELVIEVNAFTRPEPFEKIPIHTLIAETLLAENQQSLIDSYGLEIFSINVLSINRTLIEKLLGVIKDSYHEDPITRLSLRIRHLYDICKILELEKHRAFVRSDEFATLYAACIEDERKGFFGYSDCLEKPLGDAPLFQKFTEWIPSLKTTYNGEFAGMVYGELPSMDGIEESIDFVRKNLV
jgi:predicted nucleotidyltransferase component of viral defense system